MSTYIYKYLYIYYWECKWYQVNNTAKFARMKANKIKQNIYFFSQYSVWALKLRHAPASKKLWHESIAPSLGADYYRTYLPMTCWVGAGGPEPAVVCLSSLGGTEALRFSAVLCARLVLCCCDWPILDNPSLDVAVFLQCFSILKYPCAQSMIHRTILFRINYSSK